MNKYHELGLLLMLPLMLPFVLACIVICVGAVYDLIDRINISERLICWIPFIFVSSLFLIGVWLVFHK